MGSQIDLKFTIPAFSAAGSHGFAVLFHNVISSVKFNHTNREPFTEDFQVLDPLPHGTGEWVTMAGQKWDYNWVSTKYTCTSHN